MVVKDKNVAKSNEIGAKEGLTKGGNTTRSICRKRKTKDKKLETNEGNGVQIGAEKRRIGQQTGASSRRV